MPSPMLDPYRPHPPHPDPERSGPARAAPADPSSSAPGPSAGPGAPEPYPFDPARHRDALAALLPALAAPEAAAAPVRDRLLARHPRDGRGFFGKSELLAGLRWLREHDSAALAGLGAADLDRLAARLRGKPVRSLSGVAVVTVFTRPHPCPGRCVFCPSDLRMPKSYLSQEPGCQRAAANGFDPFAQTWSRLRALVHNGHPVDKVELLVLGGTWSACRESYQVEFVAACLEALNRAGERLRGGGRLERRAAPAAASDRVPVPTVLDGRRLRAGRTPEGDSYNRRVAAGDAVAVADRTTAAGEGAARESAAREATAREPVANGPWHRLEAAQRANETAGCRCVGLVLETRPDCVDGAEVHRLRRLGATKVQVGLQSLSDPVLAANRRGHDVAAGCRAVRLLRAAGFKVQAHWMANLLGSDPAADRADFRRLFDDPAFRPDELKIYPCSLVESAELMRHWEAGEWRPYGEAELLGVVTEALAATPRWCRLSRVVRDIPGTEVVAGSRVTNLRQVAEAELARQGREVVDVRAREVRFEAVDPAALELRETVYATACGEERFLEMVTAGDRLAGFLRLSLPRPGALEGAAPELAAELAGRAVVREVHVYGPVARLGGPGREDGRGGYDGWEEGGRAEEIDGEGRDEEGREPGDGAPRGTAQHRGLGTRLVERAAEVAAGAGFRHLAVISAVGTRAWYRRLGFIDGVLYQHRPLARPGGRSEGPALPSS